MTVVDASALVAIIKLEADAEVFRAHLAKPGRISMAAPTKLEVWMVAVGRYGSVGLDKTNALIARSQITITPFTESLAELAAQAFLKFGKGRGHPAQLNFGDCMAYALAKSLDAPLLYKGDDFAKTDIRSALDA